MEKEKRRSFGGRNRVSLGKEDGTSLAGAVDDGQVKTLCGERRRQTFTRVSPSGKDVAFCAGRTVAKSR